MMYSDPKNWTATFQSHALLTMARNHSNEGNTKFIERSIFSTNYVFMQAHKIKGSIDEVNWNLLQKWFDFLLQNNKIRADAIIYFRTKPEVAFERMKIRARPEEKEIDLSYINLLHEKYDDWLIHAKYPWPCQIIVINANQSTEQIMKDLNNKISQIR